MRGGASAVQPEDAPVGWVNRVDPNRDNRMLHVIEVGLAEAAYDNEAEWPDELVFRRGDILHVLDQQPAGGLADGWWLCADKQGRRGIAPANRLKMIHTFGQGQDKVITPRRFGDVFLYNHRLFNDADDDFFRQPPPLGSLFGSVYDVPTALRNLYLLHASDHPFIVPDKIGNTRSASHDLLSGGGGVSGRQPVVRTVPIRMERREDADRLQKTSDNCNVLLKSSSAPHRSRSPPPPPPQRRHFNLAGPPLLSSLAPPATTSSNSSSGSDEERVASGAFADQPSPNTGSLLQNGLASTPRRLEAGNGVYSTETGSSIRPSPGSFYDSPSLLTKASPGVLKVSPNGSSRSKDTAVANNASSPDSSLSFLSQRSVDSGAAYRKDASSNEQHKSEPASISLGRPFANGNASLLNALSSRAGANEGNALSILTTYDVPRSLRTGMGQSKDATAKHHRDNPLAEAAEANSTANYSPAITDDRGVRADNGAGDFASGAPSKPGLPPSDSNKMGMNSETDAERLSVSSMDSKSSDYQELLSSASELRLSSGTALDTLIKLLESLQAAVDKLLSFTTARNWRRKEYLESHMLEMRSCCRQTIIAVKDFHDFASGAFVNVHRIAANGSQIAASTSGPNSADGRLAKHLAHLVRPLGDSLKLLIKLQQASDISGWMASKLAREGAGNDSLDQFVAVAKHVPHDARQVASFVHGNIALIFPAPAMHSSIVSSPRPVNGSPSVGPSSTAASHQGPSVIGPPSVPLVQPHHQRSVRFADDVHLSTGEVTTINGGGNVSSEEKPHTLTNGVMDNGMLSGTEEIEEALNARCSVFDDYDYVGERAMASSQVKNGESNEKPPATPNSSILSAEDRQILQFYAPQVENHIACLSNAIDDFLSSVEQNQPPKLFVSHSKFVILGAHKLVYIGDSIAQCLQRRELSEKVKLCANNLCDVLKYCVTATKQAALQYPSIPCVQAMVDSMVNVSHAAYELKLLIQEAANL